MAQQNNQSPSLPLWKRLNQERTQGNAITITSGLDANYLMIGSDKIGEIYCGSEYEIEEAEANTQFTALAVNHLASLAEALQTLIADSEIALSELKEYRPGSYRMEHTINQAKEALNKIS